MLQFISGLHENIRSELWRRSSDSYFFRTLLALYAVLRDLGNGYISICAKSLVYTTLLSMVPLLAVSFSFLKAFGVHNQIKPFLSEALLPLGAKGIEISDNIVGFIDNVNVGVLGAVGIIVLLFTVVSVISTVESTLNSIWHIAKPRKLLQRISYYLSVIIFAPVLVFSGIGLTASVLNADLVQSILVVEPLGSLYYLLMLLAPYLLLSVAFMLVYIFLPNTKVEIRAAFVGAIIAATMWRVAGEIFAEFVANFSNYDAIYSGFAALILFLIWLYVSWLIFLFGGKLAFYLQHPESIPEESNIKHVENYGLSLVLNIMILIVRNAIEEKPRWNNASLVKVLGVPTEDVQIVVTRLEQAGMLLTVDDNVSSYYVAKELEKIEINTLLRISKSLQGFKAGRVKHALPEVTKLILQADSFVEEGFNSQSLKSWIVNSAANAYHK